MARFPRGITVEKDGDTLEFRDALKPADGDTLDVDLGDASISQALRAKIGTLVVQGVGDTNSDSGQHVVEKLTISEADANTGLDVTYLQSEKKLILYLPAPLKERVKNITLDGTTLRWTEVDSTGAEHQESAAITGSGGSGLTQAQVDDRIETFTGQTSPTDTLARNRLQLATDTQPGTISAAMKQVIDRVQDTEGPGNTDKLLGLTGAQGQIAAVDAPSGSGLTEAEVDARADDRITTAARGLTSTSLHDTDSFVVSDANVGSGDPRRLYPVTDLDTRIAAKAPVEDYAKTGTTDRIPESRLPLPFEGLEDEFKKVGWLDDASIRLFIGPDNGSAYTSADIAGLAYVQNPQHGTALENVYVAIRVTKDRAIGNLRIVEDDDNDNPAPSSGWTAKVHTDANYDYYQNLYARIEAGSRLQAQQYNALVLDEAETLKVVKGNISWNDLTDRPVDTSRELLNGSMTGIAVNSITANSGVSRTNLVDPLDLDTEGHGLLAGSFTFGVMGRSNTTIGLVSTPSGDNDLTTKRVSFGVALEDISRSAVYLQTSNQFGIILAEANVFFGSTLYGVIVVRAARDANNVVGLNAQFLADSGTPSQVASFNVTLDGVVISQPTGIPRGGSVGAGGVLYDFENALPDASGYADGTYAGLWNATPQTRGIYRKGSVVDHQPADTGLAGKVINPSSDLRKCDSRGILPPILCTQHVCCRTRREYPG